MKKISRTGKIQAKPTPQDQTMLQVTYETEDGRAVINIPNKQNKSSESEPHGAGSFHDPALHQQLMDRVDDMLNGH